MLTYTYIKTNQIHKMADVADHISQLSSLVFVQAMALSNAQKEGGWGGGLKRAKWL